MAQFIQPVRWDQTGARERLLDVHDNDTDKRRSVHIVRNMLASEHAVDEQQFAATKTATLKTDLRNRTAEQLADEIVSAKAAVASENEGRQDAREGRRVAGLDDSFVMDFGLLARSSNPSEVSANLADAAAIGPEVLRKAWRYAEPTPRRMASADRYRMSTSSALSVYTNWKLRVDGLARRDPDRDALKLHGERRQHEVEQNILEVADVAHLRVTVTAILAARRRAR